MSREHLPAAAGAPRTAAGPQMPTAAPLRRTGGSDISRYRGGANKEMQ
ncbi:hypothetical protein [Streptomyces sp. NPDC057686]